MQLMRVVALGFVLATSIVLATAKPGACTTRYINVRALGAKGDGVTNDTGAINLAIFYANQYNDPDTIVFFEPGNYLYTSPIQIHGITLAGRQATLTGANTDANVNLSGSHTGLSDLNLANKVQGTLTAGVTVFATDSRVVNCTFEPNFGNAIFVGQGSTRISLVGNYFSLPQGQTQTGIRVSGCTDSTIQFNGVHGTSSQGGTGISVSTSTGVKLSYNSVFNLARGITVSNCQSISVANTVSVDCSTALALTACPTVSATDNNISGSIATAGQAILCSSCSDAVISKNTISNQLKGILPNSSDNARITENTVTNTTEPIYATSCNNIEVTSNTLSGGTFGIGFVTGHGKLSQNKISEMATQGIVATNMTSTIRISNNALKNCGLLNPNPAAVIYQNSLGASSIVISDNTYEGNKTNLQYFIWDVQPTPPSIVSGNTTNTLLPNRIGS
jgi:parallel beta-helix repeat protein